MGSSPGMAQWKVISLIGNALHHVPVILNHFSRVMAGLVAAIHVFLIESAARKTWMPAQASLRSLRKLGCKRGHDGEGRDAI